MPHLRPLGDLIDPRLGVAGRRRARRRLAEHARKVVSAPASAERRVPWFERTGRNAVDVPQDWVLEGSTGATWAVVLHHLTGDDLDNWLGSLSHDGPPCDVLVLTESPEVVRTGLASESPGVASVHVLRAPAGSRDWSLTALANAGLLDNYTVIRRCTSAEPWPGGRCAPSHEPSVTDVLSAFATDAALGMLSPEGSTASVRPVTARSGVQALLRRLELARPTVDWMAPACEDYWVRGFILQGLRSLGLSQQDFRGHRFSPPLVDRETFAQALGALASEAGCQVRTQIEDSRRKTQPWARVVAFYLPQFHPIPENNRWWGEGFTEWTNVASARPIYRGHFQPKIPQDLGFYDLRTVETPLAQVDLARRHGLSGFMYYHYWFAGRRLLERPLQSILEGELDFPFCIMWANENWTRAWDGGTTEILLGQDYESVPTGRFIEDVLPYLRDNRYLRVNGRAVLSVYRPGQIPNLAGVLDEWRRRASQEGVDLFLLSVDVSQAFDSLPGSPDDYGFDGHMGFPPHGVAQPPARHHWLRPDRRFTGMTYDYAALVRSEEANLEAGLEHNAFPAVMVNFDNTARRQWDSILWVGSNPYTFRRWLSGTVAAVQERPEDERLVFVNAWNEWAEGAVLEPTTRFGRTFLLAVRDVVGELPSGSPRSDVTDSDTAQPADVDPAPRPRSSRTPTR